MSYWWLCGLLAAEVSLTAEQMARGHLQTAQVSLQRTHAPLLTFGNLTFNDFAVAHVYSPVNGRVMRMFVQLGDRVQAGEPLALLQSPDLGQVSSDVNKARADLIAAQRNFDRLRSLYQAHAGAQKDYELAKDTYLKAKSEFERTQEKENLLMQKDGNLTEQISQSYVVRAPVEGEVLSWNVTPGQEVQGLYAGAGNPVELFTVGSLSTLWLQSQIFEMDVGRVSKDQNAIIKTVAYPEESFTARIDYVAAVLDPNTRTLPVRCTVQNKSHRLKPNMFASVMFEGAMTEALVVPRSATFRLGNDAIIWVQSAPNSFTARVVQLGLETRDGQVIVTEGLTPGETIVTSGGILLIGLNSPAP